MANVVALQRARVEREDEKARYVAANSRMFPDIARRWVEYENLMLMKFGPDVAGPNPPRRCQALDLAWIHRDRYNQSRVSGKKS